MENKNVWFQTADLARASGLTTAAVRDNMRRGALIPTARTNRGVALFSAECADNWLKARAARAARIGSGADPNRK